MTNEWSLGTSQFQKKFNCKQKYLKILFHWIVIGLSIHFEKWIWIWIVNHKFAKDLDWIDNPNKLD